MQQLAGRVAPMAEHDEQLLRHSLPPPEPSSAGGTSSALGGPHRAFAGDTVAQLRWAQKMETLGRLTARVVHEVNNQVTLMLNRTRLVLQREGPQLASRAEVEELNRAAENVARLMRQWQTLGRREPPARRPLDLNGLVAETFGVFSLALDAGIARVIDLRAAQPWVLSDRGQMETVILNLLFNARDAMGGSGRLTLRTTNVELRGSDDDFLLPFTPGPHVRLTVRDTGSGIERATLARIFEPYFTTKAPGKGTGLGLHNVLEIVRESGGTLQVSSTPGEGSLFAVYLPQAPEPAAAPPRTAPRQAKATILVVEDEDSVRALLHELLRRQGYAVLEARDGRAALQVADAHAGTIDLLVTDCLLPHLSGAELAREMRDRFTALRVLFVSGYPASEAALFAGIDPGDPFLQKPFTPAALSGLVREVLGARG
jgi:signal transduction histidine kinase/CheY-like chemotaxis protein